MVCAKLNPLPADTKLATIAIMLQRTVMVPRRRLELPRPNGHWHLKPARLPIPPPGHAMSDAQNGRLRPMVRIATNDGVSNLFRCPVAIRFLLDLRSLFDDLCLYF